MQLDQHGLELTTDSADAARLFDACVIGQLEHRAEAPALPRLDAGLGGWPGRTVRPEPKA